MCKAMKTPIQSIIIMIHTHISAKKVNGVSEYVSDSEYWEALNETD